MTIQVGCKLGLDPQPTKTDIVGCLEYDPTPAILEKMRIDQAVEDLLREMQDR